MKRKGFTLAELLGVIVILGLLAIVSFPPILNQLKKSQDKLSDATLKVLSIGAENYIDEHPTNYPIKSGNIYCINLETLVNYGYLKSPIMDASSGDAIDETNNSMKVTINGVNNYNIEMVEKGSCVENRS